MQNYQVRKPKVKLMKDILPHEKQIYEYVKTIEHLKKQNQDNSLFNAEISKLEEKLDKLKEKVYSEMTPWERVGVCRHPQRPKTLDYIENICDSFVELHGDRLYRDDPSIIGGLATIQGIKCVLIGQEKGNDTETRVKRNFGMLHPEGFRKAFRLMKMAERFGLPIVSLLDTPGAYPGLEAEERGQGWAIAHNLKEMSILNTQIIVIVIGEGCSGGALGMGIGDVIGMLEHSYYSVISPEGCASILWKDASKNIDATTALKLNAEHLLEFGLIDEIIPEPLGGAHHNPGLVYENVIQFISEQYQILKRIPSELLLEQRYLKFRNMGEFRTQELENDRSDERFTTQELA
jgi:acetyl-CoA carboxylase carboxyl transferase subunit alpha